MILLLLLLLVFVLLEGERLQVFQRLRKLGKRVGRKVATDDARRLPELLHLLRVLLHHLLSKKVCFPFRSLAFSEVEHWVFNLVFKTSAVMSG